ncbi:MAG: condensation domain-containing protein, partial [Psychrosphaera sp.]|nr:condensation domain-containing protein [Psychrosphaera sp.]
MKSHASTLSLLVNLTNIGCRVWLENNKVKVRTGKNGISAQLKIQLQQQKEAIKAFLIQEAQDSQADWTVINRQPTDAPLTLSFAQQRLWFLAQLEGPSATYNMPMAYEIKGSLDITVLENTLATLVERQQCLRLCFPEVDGEACVREIPAYNP